MYSISSSSLSSFVLHDFLFSFSDFVVDDDGDLSVGTVPFEITSSSDFEGKAVKRMQHYLPK